MQRHFARIADRITDWTGSPWASILAVLAVLIWFAGVFHYGFGNTNYQLLINTGTTIVTFIMVFLIQHSTNRGTRALQVKLDALIEANDKVKNLLVGAEDRPEEELKQMQAEERRESGAVSTAR